MKSNLESIIYQIKKGLVINQDNNDVKNLRGRKKKEKANLGRKNCVEFFIG